MVRNQAYGCIEQVVFFLGAVLLEIRYGSVPPGSPNSEPILGEKNEHVPFHIGFQSWPRKSTLVFRPGLKDLYIVCQPNGELKQRRRRRQRERQKSNRVLSPKQQLCTCITLFCTFLCRRCTTTPWNLPISRFVEDANAQKRFSFSFSKIRCQKNLLTFDEMNEKEQERWSVRQHEVFFLYLNLSSVPDESTPGKYAYIWHFRRIWMNAIKFEKTRIHFKSDVFAAIAVVDAKAP